MKKFVRSAILLVLVLVVGMATMGCSVLDELNTGNVSSTSKATAADLVGQWSDDEDDTAILEFFADDTYTYSWSNNGNDYEWSGTYTVDGINLTVTDFEEVGEKTTNEFGIENGMLDIWGGMIGGDYTFMQ